MPIYVDTSPTDDELIDAVLRYASTHPDLQTQLLARVVQHLIDMGWKPLLAELEVHQRLRMLAYE